jgi:hypothetical protein
VDKQATSLQARIDRTAAKLAALKAQQQAREAREKTRHHQAERAMRNRALVLWGVAMERAALDAPEGTHKIRALLERHLTRENERTVALDFLNVVERAAPTKSAMPGNQNGASQQ